MLVRFLRVTKCSFGMLPWAGISILFLFFDMLYIRFTMILNTQFSPFLLFYLSCGLSCNLCTTGICIANNKHLYMVSSAIEFVAIENHLTVWWIPGVVTMPTRVWLRCPASISRHLLGAALMCVRVFKCDTCEVVVWCVHAFAMSPQKTEKKEK